jgi:prephenate dehydrogenase
VSVPATSAGERSPGGHLAVCGGGLIGASLALAVARTGRTVIVHDRDATVCEALRAIADGHPSARGRLTAVDTWAEAATGASMIVAAVPPTAIPSVLAEAAALALPDAVLTDVAGVKREVVAATSAALTTADDATSRFVGGHPMAGSERSGPGAADADLFSGATWILTPTDATSDAALAAMSDIVRAIGARVLVLTPDVHDTIVGLVSHLPQLIASVLTDVAAEAVGAERDAVMAVAGPGFRDTTRIAASDPGLWVDIIDGNREAIGAALEAFAERFTEVREAIGRRDAEVLGNVLRRASDARRRLVPKAIDQPTSYLTVPLRDRPGEIARITGALGSAGINIEDLAMRHATAADRGSLLLRVRSDAATRAVEVLAAAQVDGVVIEQHPQQLSDAGPMS